MHFVSGHLPPVRARLGPAPEDFVVDEIPTYGASGDGPHTILLVEKRGLTTDVVVRELARRFERDARDIGVAGQKDRHAVTTQQISLPDLDPAVALSAASEKQPLGDSGWWRVLTAQRHGNKLKTGHLRGNRFKLTLDLDVAAIGELTEAATALEVARAAAIISHLGSVGLPNRYGEQRFGMRSDNAERGRALLLGRPDRSSPREKRLFLSALQSQMFNQLLEKRLELGPPRTLLGGDVCVHPAGHKTFVVATTGDELELERARATAGEIVPTGPMFGPKMHRPAEGSPADQLEQMVLSEAGLTVTQFAQMGKLSEGTRRELAILLADPVIQCKKEPISAENAGDTAPRLELSFGLPRGVYATIVLGELFRSALVRENARSPLYSVATDIFQTTT